MPDANALNLGALRTAVLGRRFPASTQTTNATRWLATAYQDVWSAADWTFKRVSRATLAVTAGVSSPTMPADFRDAIVLFDEQGVEIPRLSQEVFEQRYATDLELGTTGRPDVFTVVNRQVILGPAPDASANFKLSYTRRLSHRQSDGTTVAAGFMDDDTDYPLWDDHHALLIPRAQAIGLQELSDPTAALVQQEYERQLDRMIADYATPLVGQWGDAWYA